MIGESGRPGLLVSACVVAILVSGLTGCAVTSGSPQIADTAATAETEQTAVTGPDSVTLSPSVGPTTAASHGPKLSAGKHARPKRKHRPAPQTEPVRKPRVMARAAATVPMAPAPQTPPPAAEFVISSFNMLGDSHTAAGGNKPGMASGQVRTGGAVSLLAQHGVDVVGFQELQSPQLREFLRLAGSTYDVYPGFALGSRGTENSLAWRKDMWELVRADTMPITYFNGRTRPMPVVLLRNRATGIEAYFANFHNPASTRRYRNQQRWRNSATAAEISLANTLIHETGLPVFVTGDMNEREEYFCALTGSAPMVSARGGSHNGSCQPPRPMDVDWIFGSAGVTFSNFVRDRSPLVQRTTDHPMVVSSVRIQGH